MRRAAPSREGAAQTIGPCPSPRFCRTKISPLESSGLDEELGPACDNTILVPRKSGRRAPYRSLRHDAFANGTRARQRRARNSSRRLCQFSPTTPSAVNRNFLHIAVSQFPPDSTENEVSKEQVCWRRQAQPPRFAGETNVRPLSTSILADLRVGRRRAAFSGRRLYRDCQGRSMVPQEKSHDATKMRRPGTSCPRHRAMQRNAALQASSLPSVRAPLSHLVRRRNPPMAPLAANTTAGRRRRWSCAWSKFRTGTCRWSRLVAYRTSFASACFAPGFPA